MYSLDEWRRLKDYSIKELAQAVGISYGSMMKYIAKPKSMRIETLEKVCEVLEISKDSINLNAGRSTRK